METLKTWGEGGAGSGKRGSIDTATDESPAEGPQHPQFSLGVSVVNLLLLCYIWGK